MICKIYKQDVYKRQDLYGSLTTVIEMDPFEFLEKIASLLDNRTPEYPRVWEN